MKIENQNILILLDDINFDQGIVKIRQNGSAGGHNGMKDIITKLKTKEIKRVKIGIGKFSNQSDLSKYVLSNVISFHFGPGAERFSLSQGSINQNPMMSQTNNCQNSAFKNVFFN